MSWCYGTCISSLFVAFLLLRHREINPRKIRWMQTYHELPRVKAILFSTEYWLLLDDKVWYISLCLIWLVRCYCTLSSYYIDLPFMAHSSSSYCIDLPFMAYSTDSSANCTVKCLNFHVRQLPSGDMGQPGSTTLLRSLKRRKIIQWCTTQQNRNFRPKARVDQAVGLYYRKENLTF